MKNRDDPAAPEPQALTKCEGRENHRPPTPDLVSEVSGKKDLNRTP